MNSITYKWIEFLVLFIAIPISFACPYSIFIKMILGISGFLYVLYVLLKVERVLFKLSDHINWKSFCKHTFIRFMVIAVLTTLFVYYTNTSLLFHVVIHKPGLWVVILLLYTFLSVYPQELIYRTLYFKRYKVLFNNRYVFIIVNAFVFSLAHIFFNNPLVLIFTFLGGLLFAMTYYRTPSTMLVSIEHAIYGCWLFTVGMGGMLGFPT